MLFLQLLDLGTCLNECREHEGLVLPCVPRTTTFASMDGSFSFTGGFSDMTTATQKYKHAISSSPGSGMHDAAVLTLCIRGKKPCECHVTCPSHFRY